MVPDEHYQSSKTKCFCFLVSDSIPHLPHIQIHPPIPHPSLPHLQPLSILTLPHWPILNFHRRRPPNDPRDTMPRPPRPSSHQQDITRTNPYNKRLIFPTHIPIIAIITTNDEQSITPNANASQRRRTSFRDVPVRGERVPRCIKVRDGSLWGEYWE